MVKVKPLGFTQVTSVKILDAVHADTGARTCTIAAYIQPNTVMILIHAALQSGSGVFRVYPESLTHYFTIGDEETALVPVTYPNLKYAVSVNDDDWDVYLYGTIEEGSIKT